MSEWAAKRFWTDVAVIENDGAFAIELDSRPVKTPAKAALRVPTAQMAEAIAEEWRAVEEKIDPEAMPFTRSANAAIDKVSVQFDEVASMLAAYGGSDLLCYRADSPAGLVERQVKGWDPLLDWAKATHGVKLKTTVGIMPITQEPDDLAALSKPLFNATHFELTALHDLIALSGSLVLGLAVAEDHLSAEQAWSLSRIDEDWQSEQWGADEEACQHAEIKLQAFKHAANFFLMARKVPCR